MTEIPEVYIVEEARALNPRPYTIRRLAREGKIPAFRAGGQWRFRKEDIDQWSKAYPFVGKQSRKI